MSAETEYGGIVYVISGPSGSGKGTVIDLLREMYPGMGIAVSATTRLPREGEAEGVNYFYKTREEFEELIEKGEVLEHTVYNGNYYGTLKSEADRINGEGKDLVLEIEVDGCGQMKRKLGDRCVTVMLAAPDSAELERRLRLRGTESEEQIQSRLRRAIEEVRHAPEYDYLLINETGKAAECAENLLSVIRAGHFRTKNCLDRFYEGYPETVPGGNCGTGEKCEKCEEE